MAVAVRGQPPGRHSGRALVALARRMPKMWTRRSFRRRRVDQALERAAEGAALCWFGKDLRLSALSSNQGIVALVVLTLVVTILTLVVTILTLVVVAEVVPLVVGVFVLKLGGAAQLVPVRDPVVVRVGTVRAGAKKSGY